MAQSDVILEEVFANIHYFRVLSSKTSKALKQTRLKGFSISSLLRLRLLFISKLLLLLFLFMLFSHTSFLSSKWYRSYCVITNHLSPSVVMRSFPSIRRTY